MPGNRERAAEVGDHDSPARPPFPGLDRLNGREHNPYEQHGRHQPVQRVADLQDGDVAVHPRAAARTAAKNVPASSPKAPAWSDGRAVRWAAASYSPRAAA